MAPSRHRLKADDRKKQIVEVALQTISQYGVPGTTVTRIAEGVGVTHSALYAHFANRQEILMAALDSVFEKIHGFLAASTREDAIERIREIRRFHTRSLTPGEPSYPLPLFEFIAASSDESLREALKTKEAEATRRMATIIDEAKCQGTVRQSVDPERAAWMLAACVWAEDTAYLMGIESFVEEDLAGRMAELVLDSILVPDEERVRVAAPRSQEALGVRGD